MLADVLPGANELRNMKRHQTVVLSKLQFFVEKAYQGSLGWFVLSAHGADAGQENHATHSPQCTA